ncbi:MAG: anthranilate synthase component I [Phycisphaerales bacterium JB050]
MRGLSIDRDRFCELASRADEGVRAVIPIGVRLLGDRLTPVSAYRRLVKADERTAPSFLFESVENGDRQGRYSILGHEPSIEVVAYANEVSITDRRAKPSAVGAAGDPLDVLRSISSEMRLIRPDRDEDAGRTLPGSFLGGWVGYAGYDSARYVEPEKLPFEGAPPDDRELPDLHFGFYPQMVVFDHVAKLVHIVRLVEVGNPEEAGGGYDEAVREISRTIEDLNSENEALRPGVFPAPGEIVRGEAVSNMTREEHGAMVERAKEYIRAGDIFQVVIGQRFERESKADPFEVYRSLRVVNPSPYMGYLQAEGCILVASSPEILCRVREVGEDLVLTNRPLAGTRKRGATEAQDRALEVELLADEKERAEHIMLVDLGRNDVGRVAERASVSLDELMVVERYSHVMHISSTVTGRLRDGLDCWDALRSTLPVGTISGAPKIRAMQIIDELEPVKRGPYGGGFGCVGLDGEMDIALTLRTIVVPLSRCEPERGRWVYHLQAAGGIVFDSQTDAEFAETVNKSAALGAAIDSAETALGA